MTPELKNLLKLTPEQIEQMQADYQALPGAVNEPAYVTTNDKLWYVIGAVLAALGVVLLVALGTVGVIALITGLIFLAAGYLKNSNQNKQNAAVLEKQKLVAQKRQAFQTKYGLNPDTLNLNSLLTNLNQYQIKKNATQTNNKQVTVLNKNVAQLASSVQNALKQPIDNDFSQVLNGLDELETQISEKQELFQRKSSLTASLKQDKQDLKELGLKLQALFAQANVENMAGYDQLYQDSLNQAKLKTQIAALKESLGDDLQQLQMQTNSTELADKLTALTEQISTKNAEINELQSQVAQLQVQLDNLADSTAVFKAKQDLANTETNFVQSSKEYLANLFAARWISRSLDLASNERFPKMLKAAQEYLALLTGGRYVGINLDKKLTVVRSDGKKREVKYLSRGTAEQLYFALKLAFIEQIKDEINLPILIDDSFVNFDDQRVSYIDQLLQKISENNQVLIFTAQKNLVDQLGIEPLTFTKGTQDA